MGYVVPRRPQPTVTKALPPPPKSSGIKSYIWPQQYDEPITTDSKPEPEWDDPNHWHKKKLRRINP